MLFPSQWLLSHITTVKKSHHLSEQNEYSDNNYHESSARNAQNLGFKPKSHDFKPYVLHSCPTGPSYKQCIGSIQEH